MESSIGKKYWLVPLGTQMCPLQIINLHQKPIIDPSYKEILSINLQC